MGIKNKTVLVIDDDPDILLFIRKILNQQGMITYEAENIEDALKKCEKYIPHLIILDLKLEGKTGLDFLNERKTNMKIKDIPVLVCSSYGVQKTIIRVLKLGASDFLIKPVQQSKLIQKVRKCLLGKKHMFYYYPEELDESASVTFKVDLVALNETECILRTPFKPIEKVKLDFNSELFEKEKVDCKMVESKTSRMVSKGFFDTIYTMIGLSKNEAMVLRSLQNRWTKK